MKKLPEHGHDAQVVLDRLKSLKSDDVRWEEGRVWCLVYHAGDEISGFLKEAYTTYFSENGLNPTAFPSLKRMESEVVSMACQLLGGDDYACGNMTTGGTESILMAIKTAREFARKKGIKHPEMVIPRTAHPAFEKGAHYFDVKAVHVDVDSEYRVDIKKMRKAINRRTVLLVGSAPQYPQGVVDPIEDIARMAKKRKILCHVDACVGGMALPFVRDLGYSVPPFDLSVPGVTSMSVDLHKYGYAAKPASLILYKNPEIRRYQYFAYCDWPGGIYVSPTMTGSRPGGSIAAAWAIMHRLGRDGYMEIAGNVMDTVVKCQKGINAIDGIKVLGSPNMSCMCFGSTSDDVEIFEVGDNMSAKGWHMDRQQYPSSLHMTVQSGHIQAADAFLADLADAVEEARASYDADEAFKEKAKLKMMRVALKLLPAPIATKATEIGSSLMGMGGGELPERTAAMYGLMTSLPNRGDLETMVVDILDKLTRYDIGVEQILPDE